MRKPFGYEGDRWYVNSSAPMSRDDVLMKFGETESGRCVAREDGSVPYDLIPKLAGHSPDVSYMYGDVSIKREIAGTLCVSYRRAGQLFDEQVRSWMQIVKGVPFVCVSSLDHHLDGHRERKGLARAKSGKQGAVARWKHLCES